MVTIQGPSAPAVIGAAIGRAFHLVFINGLPAFEQQLVSEWMDVCIENALRSMLRDEQLVSAWENEGGA